MPRRQRRRGMHTLLFFFTRCCSRGFDSGDIFLQILAATTAKDAAPPRCIECAISAISMHSVERAKNELAQAMLRHVVLDVEDQNARLIVLAMDYFPSAHPGARTFYFDGDRHGLAGRSFGQSNFDDAINPSRIKRRGCSAHRKDELALPGDKSRSSIKEPILVESSACLRCDPVYSLFLLQNTARIMH